MRELEEAGEMELHSAFLFVVVASAALLLIFYFMSAMSLLITVLFSFIATISLGAAVYPYVDHITNNKFSYDMEVPFLGPTPTLVFCLAPFCILTVVIWLITKSWILNNILAISLIIFFLTTIRISSLMVNTVLLVLAFFYDIFWVFCSSAVFGSNVMVTVATQLDVPIKILVPLILSQEGPDLQFTLIGLGDIVLPGLLLGFAMRFDDSKRIDLTSGYFAVTMTGYIVGLTMCEVIVGSFHLAQPAMIYLVPGTLIPFYVMALYRGELGDAWKGIKGSNYIDIVEERP
jgi:signal peptide peptidase-like protein 2B